MKKNIKSKIMVILGSVATSISAASIPINVIPKDENSLNNIKNNVNNVDNTNTSTTTKNNDSVKQSALVPFDFNESWPLLVQNTGPIVSYKNKISSLDWFSSTRWSIDILEAKYNNEKLFGENPTFVEYTDRAFINWALDRNKNILWLLSNAIIPPKGSKAGDQNVDSEKPNKQKLIKINSLNGEILDVIEIAYTPKTKNYLYYSISTLESGNVMVYGQGNDDWEQFDILDTKTRKVTQKTSESKDIDKDIEEDLKSTGENKGDVRSRFLFSIAPNMNILVMTNFGWNNQPNFKKENFGDIYFAFVDDNMNRIVNNQGEDWYYAKKMIERTDMGELNSESDTFPKLVYKLPDGRVLFSIYNKLYVFFPTETQRQKKPVYKEFNFGVKDSTNNKYLPVESWTTDTDNNVYAKFSNDGKIQKVSINGNTLDTTTITTNTYYNIAGNSDQTIKENANNFVLYNVYGYSGQIMMLNPRKVTDKKKIDQISDDELKKQNIGIAVAVTKNKSGNDGDTKGYLNTEKAFVKSSDFDIDKNILQNKLPSEISRNDLIISYDGFFTQNATKDEHGKLKYPQFVKEVINDDGKKENNEGNLKITANIDQIPWFVSNNIMPSDIPPLTITKWFNTNNNISSRIAWKDVNLDYDFKNTLPTKVTLDDVKKFDPFTINITSQQTTINGEKYPKKEYSVSSTNDSTGEIKIKASYSYLPIDVETKKENVLTATFEKSFTLFKKDDKKDFIFIGKKEQANEDIKNIPQLKELSESNLLPSSISSTDTQSILKFINTDSSTGYPISKMNFTVTPNDAMGTLQITGRLSKDYYGDSDDKVFTKTYSGLNKTTDYTFTLNENPSGFVKKNYRPSDINEQIIYKHFLAYKGYNSSSLEIVLTPNDDTGELNIKFILDKSYPDSVADNVNGFVKTDYGFVLEKTITGFKTNQEYETQYQVVFLDDNDKSLDDIKKFTPKQIQQSLKENGTQNNKLDIKINNQKITSEKELSLALIKSLGSSFPNKDSLKESDFLHNIYYNDPNGEITVKLTFKNIPGTTSDLVFIQRFTGFAKGNQVTTDDILSFKTQSKLFLDNPDFRTQLPSELAKNLNDESKKQSEIKKYINYYSGTYQTAIESNKFKLEVVPNDIYGYLTIKITFERTIVVDQNSLLTYTTTYSGFAIE